MTHIAYLDCFAGVSGDMLLGALVDAGWPLAELQTVVDALGIPGVTVSAAPVNKQHLAATHVSVYAPEAQPLRHPSDLIAIIEGTGLSAGVRERSVAIIRLLAEAEARVHGISVEKVHLHEVGAVDTLVDVVGTVAGLEALGVTRVISAPLPWSQGTIKIAHGHFPVPPPAVAVLMEGVPVMPADVQGELVTPTGAALVKGLADSFGLPPAMTVQRVSHGAGTKNWPDRPNVLRLVLGEVAEQGAAQTETLTVLACNLDDMVSEWYGPLVEATFAAGALDVWLTPVQMKKGRPGVVVEVLCRPNDAPKLRDLVFHQTTTLGVRESQVTRWALPREMRTVETAYGPVRVKVALLADGTEKASPEHDDCAALAQQHGVSVREIWQAALSAVHHQ